MSSSTTIFRRTQGIVSGSCDDVFKTTDILRLQRAGLLTLASTSRLWRLDRNTYRQRLRQAHVHSYERMVSITSTADSQASDVTSWYCRAFVEVPISFESWEALAYIGFTWSAARIILERYRSLHALSMEVDQAQLDPRIDMLQVACKFIEYGPDCGSELDDWNTCLLRMGINGSLRRAIMHSDGDLWRYTRSASYWACDLVKTRWLELIDLQNASIQASVEQTDSNFENWTGRGGTITDIVQEPITQNAPVSGLTVFAGNAQTRLAGILDSTGSVADWESLCSGSPFDLAYQSSVCFAAHREVAERYAQWVQRGTNGPVAIIELTLPNMFLHGRTIEALHVPDPTWKKLVCQCARRDRTKELVKSLRLCTAKAPTALDRQRGRLMSPFGSV